MESDRVVFCPILNRQIKVAVCFDICMVVDDGAPEWSAPGEALAVPGFREICSSCPNHRED